MNPEAFEELKFTLAAYDTANTHAMRLWYAASLISVPILSAMAGLGDLSFIGDDSFRLVDALPGLVLILAALNFIFVVAQVSHYRMAEIYRSLVLAKLPTELKLTEEYSWRDLALSAPIAGHNRIKPVFAAYGMKESRLTKILKAGFDIAFGFFPAVGLLAGLWQLWYIPMELALFIAISITVGCSTLISLVILKLAYDWVRNGDF